MLSGAWRALCVAPPRRNPGGERTVGAYLYFKTWCGDAQAESCGDDVLENFGDHGNSVKGYVKYYPKQTKKVMNT
eukprot:893107-Heterocapsa_arctica.AAC.1